MTSLSSIEIPLLFRNIVAFDNSHPLLFTQFDFWLFLLIVYAGFCLIVEGLTRRHPASQSRSRMLVRNGYLFIVSLFFYYKTSGLFVLLLVFATLVGYLLGKVFARLRQAGDGDKGKARTAKALMILGVVVNLAVLFFFKYAYFFTDIFNTIAGTHYSIAATIILPVGISFFTFQNISYIVDVYKGKVAHADNLLDFGFYTTFFPSLVAGPILRADQFIPQVYKPFHLTRRQFGIALFWILNGLAKKIILSDYLALSFVDRVFANPTLYTPFENFSALLVYSLQVYADFSGYTDIAIGVAMLMGFYLPMNFNSPYKATNPAGFWKRWHISLSNWLKDYLYIPLGGNRKGTPASYLILGGMLIVVALMAKTLWVTITVASVILVLVAVYAFFPAHRKEFNTNINNMDTMLLGGLWHGASFNFITWGGLNGAGILVYKWWKKMGPWSRMIAVTLLLVVSLLLRMLLPCPLLNMLTFAFEVVFAAIIVLNVWTLLSRSIRKTADATAFQQGVTTVWNTFLTFIFISFTRLFFRSGSNLDPAEANELAWNTATQMVTQIGSHWNLKQIPDIVSNYRSVFIVFLLGMVVHWLPDRFKRRYRLWFAKMPLWLMAVASVVIIFVVYQFITADLQPFIYFQF